MQQRTFPPGPPGFKTAAGLPVMEGGGSRGDGRQAPFALQLLQSIDRTQQPDEAVRTRRHRSADVAPFIKQ